MQYKAHNPGDVVKLQDGTKVLLIPGCKEHMRAHRYIIQTLQHLDESDWRMDIIKAAGLDFTRYDEAKKLQTTKETKKKADRKKEIQDAVDLSSDVYQCESDLDDIDSLFD